MREFIAETANDMLGAGKALAEGFKGGEIVLLSGDLGAGKTTFIGFLCKELGYTGRVTSPTFAIMNCYDGDMPIYHYDMYRIHGADALYDTGYYDFVDSGISLIEWSENVSDGLDSDIITVSIELCGDYRKITFSENI